MFDAIFIITFIVSTIILFFVFISGEVGARFPFMNFSLVILFGFCIAYLLRLLIMVNSIDTENVDNQNITVEDYFVKDDYYYIELEGTDNYVKIPIDEIQIQN